MERYIALVTASHPSAKYRACEKPIHVSKDSEGMWFADAQPYGCGKSWPTATEAVNSLLGDNGCTAIVVHSLTREQR